MASKAVARRSRRMTRPHPTQENPLCGYLIPGRVGACRKTSPGVRPTHPPRAQWRPYGLGAGDSDGVHHGDAPARDGGGPGAYCEDRPARPSFGPNPMLRSAPFVAVVCLFLLALPAVAAPPVVTDDRLVLELVAQEPEHRDADRRGRGRAGPRLGHRKQHPRAAGQLQGAGQRPHPRSSPTSTSRERPARAPSSPTASRTP